LSGVAATRTTDTDQLAWDEAKYASVKEGLLSEGQIVVARGRGGRVGLAADPTTEPLKVFISYAHVDTSLKDDLRKHLQPLCKLNLIQLWHDQDISPGRDWGKEIVDKLNTADVILFLVSVDFINSQYCYNVEMEAAMERHGRGEARVIPIILRPCLWSSAPFAKLEALPSNAQAVMLWPNW
jgi:hypothetical protein